MAGTCLYFNREIAFHADREITINYQNNNNIKIHSVSKILYKLNQFNVHSIFNEIFYLKKVI